MQICLQIFVYFSMPGRLSNGNTKMLKECKPKWSSSYRPEWIDESDRCLEVEERKWGQVKRELGSEGRSSWGRRTSGQNWTSQIVSLHLHAQ